VIDLKTLFRGDQQPFAFIALGDNALDQPSPTRRLTSGTMVALSTPSSWASSICDSGSALRAMAATATQLA